MNTDTNRGTGAHSEAPYLSIVVTSRNDGHGGSPLSRTQTFLNSLADQCRRHSLNAELVFVEWNPPEDRPRLCHVLREPDRSSFLDVRFIEVPAEIHRELANHDKLGLFQMIAKNVGIRRSRGEFVLATNIDLLFSEELIAFLARRELREDSFYVAERHDLGVYDIPPGLYGQELMDFARRNVVRINYQLQTLPVDQPPPADRDGYLNTNACGDFTLMSREAWGLFGGYAELQLYSIHIDSLGLLSAREAGLKQCALKPPLNTFHIEHGSGWMTDSKAIVSSKPALDYPRDCQPCFYWSTKNGVAPTWNDPDWGYEGVNFRECSFSDEYNKPVPGLGDAARERHRHWSELAEWNWKYPVRVRNTPDDLARLESLAARHLPDVVAAFGCDPARLAALAEGAGSAPIFCFGKGVGASIGAAEFLHAEPERFRNAAGDIGTMAFPKGFEGKRVFLLIDAAELAEAEIANVIDRILPRLALGSLVLLDNVWHSPQLLISETAWVIFRDRILPCLDALRPTRYQIGAYHEVGSLIGLSGTGKIVEYINSNAIRPCLASRRKGIWFAVDDSTKKTGWAESNYPYSNHGEFFYSPLRDLTRAAEEIAPERMIGIVDSLVALGLDRNVATAAEAICLTAAGRDREALAALERLERAGAADVLPVALSAGLKGRLHPPCGDRTNGRRRGLTLFTTAKPFSGHAGAIQRLALKSWAALSPRPEIILFGDEDGAKEFAGEIGARHIPFMRRNEYGTPLVNDLITRAQDESTTGVLAYVNADMLLFDDFAEAARRIAEQFPAALGVGQRWEIPAPEPDVLADSGWRENLRRHARTEGFFEGCFSADYFIFTPGVWPSIPPFALGRLYWDNWLIGDARERGVPVVDASDAVLAIHQSHDYGHANGGRLGVWHGHSTKRNKALFGRDHLESTMALADWLLDAEGNFVASPEPRRPDPEDNKRRRYAWLMRQSRILLDKGRLDAVKGMIEELRVRTFSDRAAIDERIKEYERLLAMRGDG